MAADVVDLWEVLDEAEAAVERWPWWQQRYEVDLFAEKELVSWDMWELSGFI